MVEVPITPKSFFRLNKSLHLFETHCAFLPLFNTNIDLLQAAKVTKSGHHLSHDRASKGYGSTPCLTSQTSLHACLQRLNTMQISLWHQTRNRPMPLTSSVAWQMMARFRNFYNLKEVKTWFKKVQCVSNRCKDLFKQTKYFGVMGTLINVLFSEQKYLQGGLIRLCKITKRAPVTAIES